MKIEYVHASHLGVTAAAMSVNNGVILGMSFAHKAGPNGRTNVEQFCRAKGRAITSARVVGASEGGTPPYTIIIDNVTDERAAIKAVGNVLHSYDRQIRQVDAEYDNQINNNDLFASCASAVTSITG